MNPAKAVKRKRTTDAVGMIKNNKVIILGIVFLLCYGHLCSGALEHSAPLSAPMPMVIPYYAPPDRLEVCGEEVPLQKQEVRERFDREFTIVVYNHSQVFLWLKRKDRFFPWLEKQLQDNKLPEDLKYVAVAESDLLHSAASPAGAVGPWQFMASTGTVYGLSLSRQVDERHDFELSSGSAFRYLQDLYNHFQNWTLAIAAYNCGQKRIEDEIKKQKVTDYYSLKLPPETERYVFRILAIKEVLRHPERYGYLLPRGASYPAIQSDRVQVGIPCSMPVQLLAETAGVTFREFKLLNPAFVSDTVPQGTYTFKVPEGKGKYFLTRLEVMKSNYKPSVVYHKVMKGETLGTIAAHYQVSAHSLREWNNIRDDKVRIGLNLKILR